MSLWNRKPGAPKPAKLDTVEKAVLKLATAYLAFPGIEKTAALRLLRTIWEFIDRSAMPNIGAALGPFLFSIAPLMFTHSKHLGARLVVALDVHGGVMARDLAQALGVATWRRKVDAARAELGLVPIVGGSGGVMGSAHDNDAA